MNDKKKLRIAIIGAGFWANYQIPAWKELEDVEIVALCDHSAEKGQKLASQFKISSFYINPKDMLFKEKIDCADIIASNDSHESLVELVAGHGVAIICQKPMASTLEAAKHMVKLTQKKKVPFMVHENWRWQTPIRTVKRELESGAIGKPFRARITYSNNFPVFVNQPFLKDLKQFILMDMGTHIFDVARFLFGEAQSIYCQIASVTPGIKGEDVATVSLKMKSGIHCQLELSYASRLEVDTFPQTLIQIEGKKGSISLKKDYKIAVVTKEKIKSQVAKPIMYSWVDPQYALVQSSIVDANRNFLESLQGLTACETTGEDNLRTLQLVFNAYESSMSNTVQMLQ